MTSSLVGSEMCIRDRFSTAPICDLCNREQRGKRFLVLVEKDPTDGTQLRICLLYTSDAADDM
eukprot:7261672-Prorocentrum_lima.AAC.1